MGGDNLSLNPTNSQKLTKFKFARLSLVCFFALNSVMSAATIPQHDANNLTIAGSKNNIDRVIWEGGGKKKTLQIEMDGQEVVKGSAVVYNSNGASIDKLTSNSSSTINNSR